MRKWTRHLRLIAALVLLSAWALAWAWASVSAQSWPALQGVVADNTGKLDSGKINSAADGLKALSVKPLAVIFQNTPGYTDPVDFARTAAAQYNLASANNLDPN